MSRIADQNLLFGILALQLDFVERDGLIAAMNAWILAKSRTLADILVERGFLGAERRTLLESLVAEHVRQHGGDPQKSLAALSSFDSALEAFSQVPDDELEASLRIVGNGGADDPYATEPHASAPASGIRFRVLRPHARGGLGQVSVAEDAELHREVALKELQNRHADNPDCRARFLLEAEITGRLEHPGIVPVYGLGHYADGRPFYAMRFIRGDSLQEAADQFHEMNDDAVAGDRSLQLRSLLGRFVDVCQAMEYAHSRGVLHRDLKPGNIMLGRYGETLVVDWGLAKVAGRPSEFRSQGEPTLRPAFGSSVSPTEMGSAIGTPAYMSPEQASGRHDQLGPRSDVYSLGATLYYVLTGRPPHTGDDLGAVMKSVRSGSFRPPREVNPAVPLPLEAICLKAMQLEPNHRYPSAAALAEDVEHWMADEPVSARRDTPYERAGRFLRKHRGWAISATAALLMISVVSVVAAVLIHRSRQSAILARNDATALAERNQRLAAKERSARKTAELERQRAADNFRRARQAVDDYLTQVSESDLLAVPGMQPLRHSLLERALAYHETFLHRQRNDPTVLSDLAMSHFRVGQIKRMIASPDDAVSSFQKALRLHASILENHPGDAQTRLALSDTHNELGRTWLADGQLQGAKTAFSGAAGMRQSLAGEFPENLEFQRKLASSFNNQAVVYRLLGETNDALKYFQASSKLRQELAEKVGEDDPAYLRFARDAAQSALNLGHFFHDLQQPQEAIQYYRAAVSQLEKLTGGFPERSELWRELAQANQYLGKQLHASGEVDAGLERIEAALALFRRIAGENPTVWKFQADRAAAAADLGRLMAGAEQRATAFAEAVAALRPAVREQPSIVRYRSDLAAACVELATVHREQADFPAALERLEEAFSHYAYLVQRHPGDEQARSDLIHCVRKLATPSQLDGALRKEELSSYQTAWEEVRSMIDNEDETGMRSVFLGAVLYGTSRLLMSLDQKDAAERYRRQAEEALQGAKKVLDESAYDRLLKWIRG